MTLINRELGSLLFCTFALTKYVSHLLWLILRTTICIFPFWEIETFGSMLNVKLKFVDKCWEILQFYFSLGCSELFDFWLVFANVLFACKYSYRIWLLILPVILVVVKLRNLL